jgi:hypothetical protein
MNRIMPTLATALAVATPALATEPDPTLLAKARQAAEIKRRHGQ